MKELELMKPKAVTDLELFKSNIEEYVFETKFDGGSSRIKIHRADELPLQILHHINPNLQNHKYPELVTEVNANVKDGDYIVELCVYRTDVLKVIKTGELIKVTNPNDEYKKGMTYKQALEKGVLSNRGVTQFEDYLKRQTDNKTKISFRKDMFPIVAVFHDIVKHGNENIESLTLMERKKILSENVKQGEHIEISKMYDTPDELLKQQDFLEGIVIKKRNSPYRFGKRDEWWKFRFNMEETVKCISYEDTETGIVLITDDGRRVNLAGERSEIARRKIIDGGLVNVEISYHERTPQGFRFTTVKRIL